MRWLIKYLASSIGRKQIMALLGLAWAAWLFLHMMGNMSLLHAQKFNEYAHMLSANKLLLYGMEVVIGTMLAIHAILGLVLYIENRKARGGRGYLVSAKKGSRSVSSFTMIYSGAIIFAFLVMHLWTLKYGAHYEVNYGNGPVRDLHKLVLEQFASPVYALLYVFSMGILASHLAHAVGSALQTLGLSHPRYDAFIHAVTLGYALLVSAGFITIATYAYLTGAGIL